MEVETISDVLPDVSNYDIFLFENQACNSLIFCITLLIGVLVGLAFWIHFK